MIKLIHGDAIEEMAKLPDNSIDLCLTDPPYGTTANKWDNVIPVELMWEQLKRLVKPEGAICLFGAEPFSSNLRLSNLSMYKYDWIWEKENGTNFLNANHQPLKVTENIHVFSAMASSYSPAGTMNYFPQKTLGQPYKSVTGTKKHQYHSDPSGFKKENHGDRQPRNVFRFKTEHGEHPTQKPVPLLEYLIKTYTSTGDTVLDFTMGSGSTGVAAKQSNREFIGIELKKDYYKKSDTRINKTLLQQSLDL